MFVVTYCENIIVEFTQLESENQELDYDSDEENIEESNSEIKIKKLNCECIGIYHTIKETVFWTILYLLTKNRILKNLESSIKSIASQFNTNFYSTNNLLTEISKWYSTKNNKLDIFSSEKREDILIELSNIFSEHIDTIKDLISYIRYLCDKQIEIEWNIDIKEL